MDTQNITLRLPADLLRKAKVLAAERRVSLSALLIGKIEEALGEDAAYEAAQKRALTFLDSAGWPLGGTPGPRAARHD